MYVVAGKSASLFQEMTVNHAGCFVRKETYSRLGTFDSSYKFAMDYELLLRFKTLGAGFVDVEAVLANVQRLGVSDRQWRKAIAEARRAKKHYGLRFARLYEWFMTTRSLISRTLALTGL